MPGDDRSYSKCAKKNVGGDENSQLKSVISLNLHLIHLMLMKREETLLK